MEDNRLKDLREAILKVLSNAQNGLSASELETKLRADKVRFWPGELQEIAWRLAASKNLQIAASGTITRKTGALMGKSG